MAREARLVLEFCVVVFFVLGLVGVWAMRRDSDIVWLPLTPFVLGSVGGGVVLVADGDHASQDLLALLSVTCFTLTVAFAVTVRVVGQLTDRTLENERKALFVGIGLAGLFSALVTLLAAHDLSSTPTWFHDSVVGFAVMQVIVLATFLLVLAVIPRPGAASARSNVEDAVQPLGSEPGEDKQRSALSFGLWLLASALCAVVVGFAVHFLGIVESQPANRGVGGAVMAGFGATTFVLFAVGAPGGANPGAWLGLALFALLGTGLGIAIVYEPSGVAYQPAEWYYACGWTWVAISTVGALGLLGKELLPEVGRDVPRP